LHIKIIKSIPVVVSESTLLSNYSYMCVVVNFFSLYITIWISIFLCTCDYCLCIFYLWKHACV